MTCNWGPSINEDARQIDEHRLSEQTGMDVVAGWNLKKGEKEGEENYLVTFGGFKGLEEGKVMGEKVKTVMEEEHRRGQVKVVHMRRIDVEGNGAFP